MAALRLSCFSSFLCHPLRLRPSSIFRLGFPSKAPPHFYATSSVVALEGSGIAPHPWPEWERFLDKLKSKGYFDKTLPAGEGEDGVAAASDEASMELHHVKAACLSFARERFDIFKSLSKEDINTIVEFGCPNLFRKTVNSAKRLRAHLRIDEGDVCSACSLRGSCDRAYIISKEDEAARTVDVVRILLSYAANPIAVSGREKPSENKVEQSARNLLLELFKLSDTIPDPSLPRPAILPSTRKDPATPKESSWNINTKLVGAQNNEMKKGDWLCPNCNFLNFARNIRCLQCKEDGPKSANEGRVGMKLGDWTCPACNYLNFARNVRCLQCKEDGPKKANQSRVEMKLGDWTCPECKFMNFSRNKKCFRCQGQRPKRELQPGEWECPSCDFINFRRNDVCLKCNRDRPKDDLNSVGHLWRRPNNITED
ncbi:zinc finger protein VAR3, chloroplastic-like [Dioscorea cayenensis subsp. rotundata]|uniref:Zinc finger protein VAR3, chloroplastic-like n=1 Tax=Dioscorea cayennensis subsp. rotundata TaxID=55577 RepID=A0AB40D0F5_DIOCR|nr:zinc finger protein VAR3, chloroplastic-like [Dioscorea cayenensis subsp. rotundata]